MWCCMIYCWLVDAVRSMSIVETYLVVTQEFTLTCRPIANVCSLCHSYTLEPLLYDHPQKLRITLVWSYKRDSRSRGISLFAFGVPLHTAENAATKPLQCFQACMSTRSPFKQLHRTAYRPTLAAFKKNQDSDNIVQILTSSTRRLPLSPSFYFQFILYPSQPLAPKLMRGKIPIWPGRWSRYRRMVVGQGLYKQKTLSVTRNMVV